MPENNKPLILIVDDNENNLNILSNILKEYSYEIITAINGADARKLAKDNSPDLIILDIMMPDEDGYETCQKLKADKNTSDIPIFFVSALSDVEDKVKGFDVGGVDFITKPFLHKEVVSRIETHLLLQKQRKELKQLNDLKDKLFSVIAHDLRNSIGGINLALQLLADEKMDKFEERRKKLFHSLKINSQKVENLLENLLYWARSQKMEIKSNPEQFDAQKAIEEIIELERINADNKSILLTSQISYSVRIWADFSLFQFVVRNLLSNAIKFTPEGGIVSILSENKEDKVEFYIKDNGRGMETDLIKNIFQKDSIVSTYGTKQEKGTGLGLSLCKEFVEKMNGQIWVESELNIGSTFYFTLPKTGN